MTDSAPLKVGLTFSRTVTVTDDMTPAHLRHESIRVLSTPDMIRLIEEMNPEWRDLSDQAF